MAADERISLAEASRRSGVSASTLKRWAEEKVIPVRRGRWTAAAAAQARVVTRMRARGHSLEDLKRAGREGRLAFGFAEDLFPAPEEQVTVEQVAEETGLEPELVERILVILGTPLERERLLGPHDVQAMRHCARVLAAGFPLVAFLQLVRVYAQSLRRIADAEVRLFHLYVHEPMIRDAVPELEMAEEMGELAGDLLPLASPLIDYLHNRYLRFFLEQDVIGHMETDFDASPHLGQVPVTLCFIDLTGFTRYGRSDAAARGDDREDDRRRGDGRLARRGFADRVGGRAARALPGAPAAAGRHPLRKRGLPRRRLLRHPRQPRPPRGQPCPGGRGAGHRPDRRGDRRLRPPWLRADRGGWAERVSPADAAVRGAKSR
jgi:DNA-binding transcriptional MerR regulator